MTHRRQPTRFRHPWDSPGENTGVGCHFLVQCMKVKSESEVVSCVRLLATPWTIAYQAPPSMGFSRQEHWSGLLFPSPRILNRSENTFRKQNEKDTLSVKPCASSSRRQAWRSSQDALLLWPGWELLRPPPTFPPVSADLHHRRAVKTHPVVLLTSGVISIKQTASI